MADTQAHACIADKELGVEHQEDGVTNALGRVVREHDLTEVSEEYVEYLSLHVEGW